MSKEKTDYPSAKDYYPKIFHCPRCGRFTHGILAGRHNPLKICNNCALTVEHLMSGEETFVRDADGSVSLA